MKKLLLAIMLISLSANAAFDVRFESDVFFGKAQAVQKHLDAGKLDINETDKLGGTYLHLAIRKNHVDVVRVLLTHPEINVNAQGLSLITPLHGAIDRDPEITRLLLSHPNIDPNLAIETYNWTPLRIAAQSNSLEVAYLLLQHPKTNVNAIDSQDYTSLDIAIMNGHLEMARLLRSFGGKSNR